MATSNSNSNTASTTSTSTTYIIKASSDYNATLQTLLTLTDSTNGFILNDNDFSDTTEKDKSKDQQPASNPFNSPTQTPTTLKPLPKTQDKHPYLTRLFKPHWNFAETYVSALRDGSAYGLLGGVSKAVMDGVPFTLSKRILCKWWALASSSRSTHE
jgi:hypothetical protein